MVPSNVIITGFRNDEGENLLLYVCRSGTANDLMSLHNSINDENRHCLLEYNAKKKQCVHVSAFDNIDAIEKIKLLVLWGAYINAQEQEEGNIPLHIAVYVKNYELVDWLCQHPKVNKEALNYDLKTPYHIAFLRRDDRMMEIFKKNGAKCKVPLQSEANSDNEDQ